MIFKKIGHFIRNFDEKNVRRKICFWYVSFVEEVHRNLKLIEIEYIVIE